MLLLDLRATKRGAGRWTDRRAKIFAASALFVSLVRVCDAATGGPIIVTFDRAGQLCLTEAEKARLLEALSMSDISAGSAVTLTAFSDGRELKDPGWNKRADCMPPVTADLRDLRGHDRIAAIRALAVAAVARQAGYDAFTRPPYIVHGAAMPLFNPDNFVVLYQRIDDLGPAHRRVEIRWRQLSESSKSSDQPGEGRPSGPCVICPVALAGTSLAGPAESSAPPHLVPSLPLLSPDSRDEPSWKRPAGKVLLSGGVSAILLAGGFFAAAIFFDRRSTETLDPVGRIALAEGPYLLLERWVGGGVGSQLDGCGHPPAGRPTASIAAWENGGHISIPVCVRHQRFQVDMVDTTYNRRRRSGVAYARFQMHGYPIRGLCLFAICLSACGGDAVQRCHEQEMQGVYAHETNGACGCGQRQCPTGTRCFKGDCCDPVIERENLSRCGCMEVCHEGQVCREGKCCDGGTELVCACDPRLLQTCGCRGPCPDRSHCENGVCRCNSADDVLCAADQNPPWGTCVESKSCLCHPEQHQSDMDECGCKGPCAIGDHCVQGGCKCDPLQHQDDNLNCGCLMMCDPMMGTICLQGTCTCDPANIDNAQNCACKGACKGANGEVCIGGACVCNPNNLDDSNNCGCPPVRCDKVNAAFECRGGRCECPADNLYNSKNCNCDGPCGPGLICQNGACIQPGL